VVGLEDSAHPTGPSTASWWVVGRSGFQPDRVYPVRLETWPTSNPPR